jgi:hypothetical protein
MAKVATFLILNIIQIAVSYTNIAVSGIALL